VCTKEGERSAVICDVAIARVRQEFTEALPQGISYSVVEGRGTRVQADLTVDGQRFSALVQEAIAKTQER
jgi:hypothetical protein